MGCANVNNRLKARRIDNFCHFIPINHDEKCTAQTRQQLSTLNLLMDVLPSLEGELIKILSV